MREPIRHAMMWGKDEDDSIYVFPVQKTNGNWVKWEDYSKLQTEVERLDDLVLATKQVIAQHEMFYATKWLEENFPKSCTESFQAENARLKAEVERLRKAGDIIARIIAPPAHGPGEWDGEWYAWHNAKSGVLSAETPPNTPPTAL